MSGRALAALVLLCAAAAPAQEKQATAAAGEPEQDGAPVVTAEVDVDDEALEEAAQAATQNATAAPGYTPTAANPAQPALRVTGYVDVGFARAQGDGTSFARGDTRAPLDYGVDTFAPMVNSRGDVASTNSSGRFTNGFLPRSAGIAGKPSFLLNTVDADVRYRPIQPLFLFARAQLMPRFGAAEGEATRVLVEQAFARIAPFSSEEFTLTIGKADSVFGIEYLENEANLRTGITPSLIARYTTGQSLGAKAFYRVQIPALWAAVSLNVAATSGGTLVESLQPQSASLTGTPVGSGRAGLELNLPGVEVKLGASAFYGPRNDQHDPDVRQRGFGADARLIVRWLSLAAEWVKIDQFAGAADKDNGLGRQTLVSGFHADGAYVTASLSLPLGLGPLKKLTPYGRYARRHAQFEGFVPITVDAITAGARLDLWDSLAVKAEGLFNREVEGAPNVPNDVFTSSLVFSW